MFWRRKKPEGPVPNRLQGESEPNRLSLEPSHGYDASRPDGYDASRPDGLDEEPDAVDDEPFEGAGPDEDAGPDADEYAKSIERAGGWPAGTASGVGGTAADPLEAELQRQAEAFGLTQDDPVALFGPNGVEVARFLDRLPYVSTDELSFGYETWDRRPGAEKKMVGIALRAVEKKDRLEREVDAATQAVTAWADAAVRDVHEQAWRDAGEEDPAEYAADMEAFYREATRAVSDAVTALVLRHDLATIDFDSLGGSWAARIAAMPEPEPDPATQEHRAAAGPDAAADRQSADRRAGSRDRQRPEAGDAKEDGEFGPNTDAVRELLGRLDGLSKEQTLALEGGWRGQPKDRLNEAHRDLRELVDEDPAWRDQVRRAQSQIQSWVNRETRGTEVRIYFGGGRAPLLRPAAAPAVADAVAALVMADLLDPVNAELLYAPWASAVGAPPLPLPPDDAR